MGPSSSLSSPPPQPGQVGGPFLVITNTETDTKNLEPSDERYNDRDSTTTPFVPSMARDMAYAWFDWAPHLHNPKRAQWAHCCLTAAKAFPPPLDLFIGWRDGSHVVDHACHLGALPFVRPGAREPPFPTRDSCPIGMASRLTLKTKLHTVLQLLSHSSVIYATEESCLSPLAHENWLSNILKFVCCFEITYDCIGAILIEKVIRPGWCSLRYIHI